MSLTFSWLGNILKWCNPPPALHFTENSFALHYKLYKQGQVKKILKIIFDIFEVEYLKVYENKRMFSPGIEPGTFCVLDRCDNRYTTKTVQNWRQKNFSKSIFGFTESCLSSSQFTESLLNLFRVNSFVWAQLTKTHISNWVNWELNLFAELQSFFLFHRSKVKK